MLSGRIIVGEKWNRKYKQIFKSFYLFSFPVDLILYRANLHLNGVTSWGGGNIHADPCCTNPQHSSVFLRILQKLQVFEGTLGGLILQWVRGPAARMQSVFVLIRILNHHRTQSSEVPLHYCWTKKSLSSDRREVWMMDNGSLRCPAIITLLPMRQQLF